MDKKNADQGVTLVPGNMSLVDGRFKVSVNDCYVLNKAKLRQYRDNWKKWVSWHQHNETEPNTIESQMHRMFFNDITYRAIVSVRGTVDSKDAISARSATLAYLLDHGYVISQILSIQKLLDAKTGVISLRRLLMDIETNRDIITREIYVAGDGLPYDYNNWHKTVDPNHPLVQAYGIGAPGLTKFAISRDLHKTFDMLSGKQEHERTRDDIIQKSVFQRLHTRINCKSASEIKAIRDNYIAHAARSLNPAAVQFKSVTFSQIDELQRAIVYVERVLTDEVLAIRIGREVVPMPPLGLFAGLGVPYCPPEAEALMCRKWYELSEERNAWRDEARTGITV
jgi:hypothetical protein